jgi:hypothetical protein
VFEWLLWLKFDDVFAYIYIMDWNDPCSPRQADAVTDEK